MKWFVLFSAIICEIVGTTALKLASQGGKHAVYFGGSVLFFYAVCFYTLGITFRYFDLGAVYAIWSGVGITLLAVIGALFFGDNLSPLKLASIALIIIGIVGLNLSGISR